LGNTRKLNQSGVTIVELLVVIGISSVLLVAFMTVSLYMYGDTVRSSLYSRMATESSTILRSVVEELRQSSSIRTSNANPDTNAPGGGWTTSNSSLILIISTPALDSSNNFIMNPDTGYPYSNEIVYFANGNNLYKRYLASSSATGNTRQTTCPTASASSSCPPDILMSSNFKDMNFIFYDQDDAVTTSIPDARSIKLFIQMQRQTFGKALQFDNNIRITIRNTAS
jgi:type II secretory pathway pseudopilin PulG